MMTSVDPTGEIAEAWGILEDNGISYETLHIVTSLNGYSVETLNDVSRAAFGVDIDDLKAPIEESTKINAASYTAKSLEDYVNLPFDLYDENVQFKICRWAVETVLNKLNKKYGKKGKEFWADDLRANSEEIQFVVIEGDDNWSNTFQCWLNWYDEDAISYDEVQSLLEDKIRIFTRNV